MTITPLMPVYPRCGVRPVRGEGCYLIGERGERYLDFAAGIAVNALGHGHPHLVQAIADQAATLMHVSNLYGSPQGEALAERLLKHSFADTVFFTNSGVEAIECAIKTARRYHYANGNPQRHKLITFKNAFHGRSLGAISATDQGKMRDGFEPLLPGFDYVPFNDLEGALAKIDDETAGFLVETIQGEGGMTAGTVEFIQGLRKAADEHGLLLILDEIQCGYGRTGKMWAYEHYGLTPDIMTSAKGIGAGFPLGACLATEEAAKGMVAGTHGSTYGGNPLACAVACAVLDVVNTPETLAGIKAKHERFKTRLEKIGQETGLFTLVRGVGLLIGCVLSDAWKGKAKDILNAAEKEGVMVLQAGPDVVRFAPSLVVEDADIDEGLARFERAVRKLTQG